VTFLTALFGLNEQQSYNSFDLKKKQKNKKIAK